VYACEYCDAFRGSEQEVLIHEQLCPKAQAKVEQAEATGDEAVVATAKTELAQEAADAIAGEEQEEHESGRPDPDFLPAELDERDRQIAGLWVSRCEDTEGVELVPETFVLFINNERSLSGEDVQGDDPFTISGHCNRHHDGSIDVVMNQDFEVDVTTRIDAELNADGTKLLGKWQSESRSGTFQATRETAGPIDATLIVDGRTESDGATITALLKEAVTSQLTDAAPEDAELVDTASSFSISGKQIRYADHKQAVILRITCQLVFYPPSVEAARLFADALELLKQHATARYAITMRHTAMPLFFSGF
jgi:hypothetical protein